MRRFDHNEITCRGMWEFIGDNLLPGEPRLCCVCEGHHCQEAIAERKRAGLPPPPEDSWCKDVPCDVANNAVSGGAAAPYTPRTGSTIGGQHESR
jgi:hypothetical protein